jgi:DNA mismatch repair protein MutS
MAGLPPAVIKRAEDVLRTIESSAEKNTAGKLTGQLPAFDAKAACAKATKTLSDELEALLTAIDPDSLTPKEAMEALYNIKALSKKA